jgi:hypothetical protein
MCSATVARSTRAVAPARHQLDGELGQDRGGEQGVQRILPADLADDQREQRRREGVEQ